MNIVAKDNDIDEKMSDFQRVRLELAKLLSTQKIQFEEIKDPNTEALKNIFKWPEKLIPSELFAKLQVSQQPRKFRKTEQNKLGFRIKVQSYEDLTCLDPYEGISYADGDSNYRIKYKTNANYNSFLFQRKNTHCPVNTSTVKKRRQSTIKNTTTTSTARPMGTFLKRSLFVCNSYCMRTMQTTFFPYGSF